MDIRQQIAERVRKESVRELERLTGIDVSTLSKIGSGERQPSGAVMAILAKHWGLELKPKRAGK